MNKTKIDWQNPAEGWRLDYTWNPLIGCKHGCYYCYAKRMNDRFKWIPKWNEPLWFWERLGEIDKIRKPKTIYVGSICDLFGNWVPAWQIQSVIKICKDNPQHRFMFLTKNPKRYQEFDFPDNCWLGVTITNKKDLIAFYKNIGISNNNKTFISMEPLLDKFNAIIFCSWELIIIGAMTGPGAIKPQKEWIESIKHPNIYYKNNIRK